MKSSIIICAVSLLASATAAPRQYDAPSLPTTQLVPRQNPMGPCSDTTGGVHVIVTPGAGNSFPPYGLLYSLVGDILTAIPGSTNVSIPYNHSETDGITQTQHGTTNLNGYIFQYHYYCPNTKIVLLGYSSGAIITMNSLCGESAPYSPPSIPISYPTYGNYVIAAVVYGDESRTKGNTFDRGTCRGVGEHPRPNPAGCNPFASVIRSYCDSGDPLCCATTGTNISDHYVYPQEYDTRATRFVVNRFQQSGGAA